MPDYNAAPTRHKAFGKLPFSNETAARALDDFIVPLIERGGMTVKVTKTKNTRTLKITLPE